MKDLIIFCIFLLFLCLQISGQNIEFDKANFPNDPIGLKNAKKNIQDGDNYWNNNSLLAFQSYMKAYEFNPNNALLNYKLGLLYLHSSSKWKAQEYLEKAYKLNPNVEKDIHYYLGMVYQINLEWEKAINEYKEQIRLLIPVQPKWQKEIERKIAECKNGIELTKNMISVFIDNVGENINSVSPDYSPVIPADESIMFFTSRRQGTLGGGKDKTDQLYFEDIYYSINENGNWSSCQNLGNQINRENMHDAVISLSADGKKLFIYRDNTSKGSGDIYLSKLHEGIWSIPEKLNENINSLYHESSASLSPDGTALYFVSERPGGLGKHDIYKSVWNTKTQNWETAENLGSIVNTPYEEHSVFIHPDGKTLFFSSRGHNSMGDFDVFKTVWDNENKKWSVPENLGYPINTADDDIDFVLNAEGNRGYYSSYKKEGYGEKDIYKITFPPHLIPASILPR